MKERERERERVKVSFEIRDVGGYTLFYLFGRRFTIIGLRALIRLTRECSIFMRPSVSVLPMVKATFPLSVKMITGEDV